MAESAAGHAGKGLRAALRMALSGPSGRKNGLFRNRNSPCIVCIYSFLFSTAAFASRSSCAFSVEGSASIQRCGMAS